MCLAPGGVLNTRSNAYVEIEVSDVNGLNIHFFYDTIPITLILNFDGVKKKV